MALLTLAMVFALVSSCGGDRKDGAVREVVNEQDNFSFDSAPTGHTSVESYRWRITTPTAMLHFDSVEVESGSVRLIVSNPSAQVLFDQTFDRSEQVPIQYLGPAGSDEWKIEVQFDNATGTFVFSLAADLDLD